MFRSRIDIFGDVYFSIEDQLFNFSKGVHNPIRKMSHPARFLERTLSVPKQRHTLFSSDLTESDDLLLAFLSLILLLVVDGVVAAILLHTREGQASAFGFSVKHAVDLLRDLDLKKPFSYTTQSHEEQGKGSRRRIAAFAALILLFTLGFEVLILFLTSPVYKEVTNKTATFRLIQPFIPSWNAVFYHSRSSINQPCSPIALSNVRQGRTRISGCVKSSAGGTHLDLFQKVDVAVDGIIDAEIISDYHKYGSEHTISFDNTTSSFSVRAYFTLGDGEMRIMKAIRRPQREQEFALLVHRQFIAYVFTAYRAVVEDEKMDLKRLNDLRFEQSNTKGPMTEILRTTNKTTSKTYQERSRRYVTKLRGILPRGSPILLFGQQFFRGMAAVSLSGPDQEDLFTNKGEMTAHAVLWRESVRIVNWLSLTILLGVSLTTLLALRWWANSVSIAEVAGLLVKQEVGANLLRSPVEADREERSQFRIRYHDDDIPEYQYGAETNKNWYTRDLACPEYYT